MGKLLAITGTPGTGKKTVAPLVASSLGLQAIALTDLLTRSEKRASSAGVDPVRLRRRLLSRVKGRCVVYGHMVPDVLERRQVERVVVLRCDPYVLAKRLRARGYPAAKVAGNVEAELIGVVASACTSKFGRSRVFELDTTKNGVRHSAEAVHRSLTAKRPRTVQIDWMLAQPRSRYSQRV